MYLIDIPLMEPQLNLISDNSYVTYQINLENEQMKWSLSCSGISTMEYVKCLAILFMLGVVSCDLCGEKNIEKLITSDSGRCEAQFTGSFSVTAVSVDNEYGVVTVLTPDANPSCIASETLSLASGGLLKIKVYSKSIAVDDYLTVLVYEGEENYVVGRATLLEPDNRVGDGWTVLEVMLEGKPHYDGYIMLVGKASSNSEILVESICYFPAEQQKLLSEDSELTPHNEALQTDSILSHKVHIESATELSFRFFNTEDFWSPLTISLAVIIPIILLAFLGWGCFALGKRQGAKQEPQVYDDIDNLPKPYLVPRVKSMYAESVESSYVARNNNIYSV
ncbi:uncharacterized protein LOC133527002 [Cydia pomonella]|uniref:uncharacterized protein LOC133527002 n=1 Tax=Cydia pomonella TaxID=82600 RepID=UPI002ADD4798|nr:uncharacterized protein LOC133527002 [Cydia pomonella]